MTMIQLVFSGAIYLAAFEGCYDGDTCRVKIEDAPPFLASQSLRFYGFDTPEMRSKCLTAKEKKKEKEMAKRARDMTRKHILEVRKLVIRDNGEGFQSKYGDLLVEAPALKKQLIEEGLARPYNYKDGRKSWCS